MARTVRADGFDVIVSVPVREASTYWGQERVTPDQAKDKADRIRQAILRHLAHDFAGAWEGVAVIRRGEEVCSHCGYAWTEDSAAYNGGCCADDEANNLADKAAA